MAIATARMPAGEPRWDEEVVPALRKRLESESRTLTKRLSIVSTHSTDEGPSTYTDSPQTSNGNYQPPTKSTPYDAPRPRKPSNTSQRVNGASTNRNVSSSSSASYQRSRTLSQPRLSSSSPTGSPRTNGRNKPSSKSPPPSDPNRSVSPRLSSSDSKPPTRIPAPAKTQQGKSTYGYQLTNGSAPLLSNSPKQENLRVVHEKPSTSSINFPENVQDSRLLQERPPFPGQMSKSDSQSSWSDREAPPRPSLDTQSSQEEKPFEHWYRGDTSRNGGVGELRVGKRQEMLDIANYGHAHRARQREEDDGKRSRKRADSVDVLGGGVRGSFYMDENDDGRRVIDEYPLTDLEGSDMDVDDPRAYDPNYYDENSIATGMPFPTTPTEQTQFDLSYRSETPTQDLSNSSSQYQRGQTAPPSSRPAQGGGSKIPSRSPQQFPQQQKPRSGSEPPSSSTSPRMQPGRAGSGSASSTPQSQKTPKMGQGQGQKRGVSPGASPAMSSASKKSRMAASQATRLRKESERAAAQENRRSVAHYPSVDGEGSNMEDAVPTWTSPKPNGNWDDVVLPVVARKKGLNGFYETEDGSPKPQGEGEDIIEPAPGTFGYDHSKYRPPRPDDPRGGTSIPMDEFGNNRSRQPSAADNDGSGHGHSATQRYRNPHDSVLIPTLASKQQQGGAGAEQEGRDSPVPFSHYAPQDEASFAPNTKGKKAQQLQKAGKGRGKDVDEEGDGGAGCCKCIIM